MTVSPLYRSSTTSLSRPSTRLRENCNDEFQKLDRYAIQGTDSFDGFLSVMTQTGKKVLAMRSYKVWRVVVAEVVLRN